MSPTLLPYSPHWDHSRLSMPDTAESEHVPINSSSPLLLPSSSPHLFPPPSKVPNDMATVVDQWPHDPRNPRNWSTLTKWSMTGIVAFYTFVT